MLARSPARLSFAAAAASFAVGAALTWVVAESVRRLRLRPASVPDDIVLGRVREQVSRIVARPDAVEVSVENGIVRVAGEVPPAERDHLLTQLLQLPGVVRLRNALGTG